MSAAGLIGERTQYLNLEQIEAVCAAVAGRLLVGGEDLIAGLRRELTAVGANGLRSGALGQGLFGPHVSRPGVIAIAGPGGTGKTYFAELLARSIYGEHFADHLVNVNCRAYFAGRFPPLPRAKIEGGPLAVVSLDGVEVLPELPPVAALWMDAIRYGRSALPAANERGEVTQVELSFGRAVIVATANVAREQAIHIGFHPEEAHAVARDEADRLIRDALSSLFLNSFSEAFSPDRWILLPTLDRAGMQRLVTLQLEALAELLPKGSPAIEITEAAAAALIEQALASRSPNKTVSLVELIRGLIGPAVDGELLRASAPVPLRVQVDVQDGAVRAQVQLTAATH